MTHVYIWQRMLSPHMLPLAEGLYRRGVQATFVYCEDYDARRKSMGWSVRDVGGVHVHFAQTREAVERMAEEAPAGSIHICEGLRRNGLVSAAQRVLRRRKQPILLAMETVQSEGWRGIARHVLYRWMFWIMRDDYAAVLAIGDRMPQWLVNCGCPQNRIFPFTYFLSSRKPVFDGDFRDHVFRVLFVGQLVPGKRVDLLFQAVRKVGGRVEVVVVGGGPEEERLRSEASVMPSNVTVRFLGRQDMSAMPQLMSSVDCLVLPSDYDGWGAVVSEALMVGTPAICSDACGAAEAVRASGIGGVFPRGDSDDLAGLLTDLQRCSPLPQSTRQRLSDWAQSLSGDAGAQYLLEIVEHISGRAERPVPPWRQSASG